jgi:hypothetical protein
VETGAGREFTGGAAAGLLTRGKAKTSEAGPNISNIRISDLNIAVFIAILFIARFLFII